MKFIETPLKGLYVIEMDLIKDDRGCFYRGWCAREFEDQGLNAKIVQQNFGFSRAKGALRGLHLQTPPHAEVKVARCVRGRMYDVAVDMRPESETYQKWFGIELSADNRKMLYLPEGFAHGYQTMEDNVEMCYFTTAFYAPDNCVGYKYDDPKLDIDWPLPVTDLSDNDLNWPYL